MLCVELETHSVATNVLHATDKVRKESDAIKIREQVLLANFVTISSGCTPTSCMWCLLVIINEGGVFLDVCKHGS